MVFTRLTLIVWTLTHSLRPHLKGLDECPQQGSDALPPAQQLDQSHHAEQAEEGDGDARAVLVLEHRCTM